MQISDWVSSILALVVIILTFVTIRLTKQSMNHEKEMRSLEVKIALSKDIYDIHIFFSEVIFEKGFFYSSSSLERMALVGRRIECLFDNPVKKLLIDKLTEIQDIIAYEEFPKYDVSKIPLNFMELIKRTEGKTKEELLYCSFTCHQVEEILQPYMLKL